MHVNLWDGQLVFSHIYHIIILLVSYHKNYAFSTFSYPVKKSCSNNP